VNEWNDVKLRPYRYAAGPVWNWFGLTYSAYLVVPRTLMCGMPIEWQRRMVALLEEMREVYDEAEINDTYVVHLTGARGKWTRDPLAAYKYPPPLPYRPVRAELARLERWLWNVADFAHWHAWPGRRFWAWLLVQIERRRYPVPQGETQ
jgi:hypothetical protein